MAARELRGAPEDEDPTLGGVRVEVDKGVEAALPGAGVPRK